MKCRKDKIASAQSQGVLFKHIKHATRPDNHPQRIGEINYILQTIRTRLKCYVLLCSFLGVIDISPIFFVSLKDGKKDERELIPSVKRNILQHHSASLYSFGFCWWMMAFHSHPKEIRINRKESNQKDIKCNFSWILFPFFVFLAKLRCCCTAKFFPGHKKRRRRRRDNK